MNFLIGNTCNNDNSLIRTNIIIYEWQSGRIIFSYVIKSAIVDLNYNDFSFHIINKNDFEKNIVGNNFNKIYQENLLNIFFLAFKKNIFLIILRKNSIEIKDLKLDGMIMSDITCCKVMKIERFLQNEINFDDKINKQSNEDRIEVISDKYFCIFTGHNEGSLVKWEINNQNEKCKNI